MMTSNEIKEDLAIQNITLASIAKKFECTPSNVHQLFDHSPTKAGKPSLIRKHIAKIIGKKYIEVWG